MGAAILNTAMHWACLGHAGIHQATFFCTRALHVLYFCIAAACNQAAHSLMPSQGTSASAGARTTRDTFDSICAQRGNAAGYTSNTGLPVCKGAAARAQPCRRKTRAGGIQRATMGAEQEQHEAPAGLGAAKTAQGAPERAI